LEAPALAAALLLTLRRGTKKEHDQKKRKKSMLMRCDLGVLNLAPVCIFAGAEANLQLPREKHLEHMSSGFTLVLF